MPIFQNRVGYEVGNRASIQYSIGHVGDDEVNFVAPNVLWLRDGVPVSVMPTNIVNYYGRIKTTLSFTFEKSDAGVYQGVFTDSVRSEVFLAEPMRLDTGKS